MATPSVGPFRADLAYESFLTLSTTRASPFTGGLGEPTSNEWLPLQGTIASGAHAVWTHRLDRLALSYTTSDAEVTIGRQAISWATTLFLTPADPFAPFDPSDPFREYRAGVDAARVRLFPGPFSEVDGAFRIADTPAGRKITAAARGKTSLGTLEGSVWGGVVFGDPAGAVGATFTAAGAAFRGELELRRSNAQTVVRGAVGVDRSFQVSGRTLYLVGEYQRDGFGAASAAALPAVFVSPAAARGELQTYGRDELALQATYQIHPLVGLEALSLVNLDDGSALLAPAASWSAGSNLTVRAGIFLGIGAEGTQAIAPGSEYGPVPFTFYASAAAFF